MDCFQPKQLYGAVVVALVIGVSVRCNWFPVLTFLLGVITTEVMVYLMMAKAHSQGTIKLYGIESEPWYRTFFKVQTTILRDADKDHGQLKYTKK